MKTRQRVKLFIILGVEFIAIAVMLLLIFFAGKQSYTVTFDLNGGTLLSGDPVQRITQGHNATPPSVTKEGHYFLRWSGSYNKVTHDVTVYAIWEYETSPGIEYDCPKNATYCTIAGAFKGLQGEIYVGAYHDGLKALGIEDGAFEDCVGITELHFLDGALTIGNNAFAGCTALESIELPNTVFTMGNGVFQNCENLQSIVLPRDLRTLGESSFVGCTALEEVVLPEGLIGIGANAFAGCESLKSIVLPTTLRYIEDGAFAGCTALETVTFFDGAVSLEEDGELADPISVCLESIGENAFKDCESLTAIALPDSVLYIGDNAFAGCTALENISLFAMVESMGSGVFNNANAVITLYSYDTEQKVIPQAWASDWNLANAEVKWEYLEKPTEEEETSSSEDSEQSSK